MIRVDHVYVRLEGAEEFEGRKTLVIEYDPTDQQDALLVAALAKSEELLRAEMAAYKGDGDLFV